VVALDVHYGDRHPVLTDRFASGDAAVACRADSASSKWPNRARLWGRSDPCDNARATARHPRTLETTR